MDFELIAEFLIENASGIATVLLVLLFQLFGKPKTAEAIAEKQKAKSEKRLERKRKKAQKLAVKTSEICAEIAEEEEKIKGE